MGNLQKRNLCRDSNRRSFVLILSSVSAWLLNCSMARADDLLPIRRARRRIQPLCAVPHADYQYGARTPSVVVRSLRALPRYSSEHAGTLTTIIESFNKAATAIETAKLPEPTLHELVHQSDMALNRRLQAYKVGAQHARPVSKLMQIADSELEIAHCSLSDIALVIEPSGIWHLSLRGNQNFLRREETRERNLDLQLKRNAFKVKVRLLRSARSDGENITPAVGGEPNFDQASKPAIVSINVPEFWVQREAPQLITETGHHSLIAAYFDDIDQAEFEFFVKLDPMTGNGHGVVQPWQK